MKVADGHGPARPSRQRELDKAELDLAEQAARGAHDPAPRSTAIVIERMKNPGESVRANEAVVQLGNLDKLRAWAYVPLEYAFRVKEGQIVEIQPRLQASARRSRCRSSRSGSGARSRSSTPRSSPSPRPPSGSTPSSTTRTTSSAPA